VILYNLVERDQCSALIYSYNKSQGDALFLKFIFDKELYTFRTDLLSIIGVHRGLGSRQAT